MRNLPFLLFFYLVVFLPCNSIKAQHFFDSSRYTVERILNDNMEGRPTSLILDRNEMLWIGSFNGLFKYNGSNFIHYSILNGLPDNNIKLLSVDTGNHVYTLTDKGISRFINKFSYKFIFYRASTGKGMINSFCAVNERQLYFSTTQGSYYVKDDSTVKITAIEGSTEAWAVGKNGNVYAWSSKKILYKINEGSVKTIPYDTATQKGNCILTTGIDGDVYFFTGTSLYVIKQSELVEKTRISQPEAVQLLLPGDNNESHFIVSNDKIFNISANHKDRVRYYENDPFSYIQGIVRTSNGVIYFSDRYLYRLIPKTENLIVNALSPFKNFIINETLINGRRVCSPENLPQLTSLKPTDAALLKKIGKNYLYIYKTRKDSIWLCTGQGLYMIDHGRLRLKYVTPPFWNRQLDSTFNNITEAPDGSLWITSFNGLIHYSKGIFKQFIPPGISGYNHAVYRFALLNNGSIVMGTGSGYFLLRDENFTDISTQLNLPKGVSQQLYMNSKGMIWISAANQKLYQLKEYNNMNIGITDSLSSIDIVKDNPVVKAMQFDNKDNLWVYYGANLIVYLKNSSGNYDVNNRIVFTIQDGLPQLGGYLFYMNLQKNGQMRLETRTAAIIFTPERLIAQKSTIVFPVLLTGILLNRAETNWEKLGFTISELGVPITPAFNYNQNNLTFQFTTPEHKYSGYIRYRFRLTGIDSGWQPFTTSENVTYNNLFPGTYKFELQAIDINQHFSTIKAYTFSVTPPWYKTWWAYAIMFVLFFGITIILFYVRLIFLRKKDAMEKLLTEQKLIALRAQINPHFLQNTFDFLARRIRFDKTDNVITAIDEISAYLRQVLYKSDKSVVSLEEEIEFISIYLKMQQTISMNAFKYVIKVSEETDIFGTLIPAMMLQPIVENAVKYGINHQLNNNLIEVSVFENEDYVLCTIADSGSDQKTAKTKDYISKGKKISIEQLQLLHKKSKHKPYITEQEKFDGGLTVTFGFPKK